MKQQKDRHLETPGEANRDKHINFLAEEMGDTDTSDETFDDATTEEVDNGFFSDDDADINKNTNNEQPYSNLSKEMKPVPADAAQTINDSVPEGGNNSSSKISKKKISKINDDLAH